MLNGPQVQPLWLLGCGVIGLVTAFLFVWITEYYTESMLSAGAVDCGGFADGAGDEHHQRTCCWDGDAGDAGDCDLGGAAAELLLRRAGAGGCRGDQRLCEGNLRDGDCHDGDAELRGLHSGDGYVWADHG